MSRNLLDTPRGRRVLFAGLYLTEGAPIGFLWWALPTVMREAGGDVPRITALLSFLALPWALKFLWAPLVDVLRGPRWTLRGWIVSAQLVMAASLVPLLLLDPSHATGWIVTALVVHGFAAATQDVAIDALAIGTTDQAERGALNGWMQAGMLLGRAVFGGGGLLVRAQFGDRALVWGLIGLLLLGVALALFYRDPTSARLSERGASERFASFGARLGGALASRTTWLALAFAATAGAGFEAVGGLAGPFLVDAGADSEAVGRFFLLPVVGAMVAGALAGGWLADRAGHRRAVLAAGLALAAALLLVAALAAGAAPVRALMAALALVYLAIGLFTASTYALFMDLTDARLGATQFSAYMGATNLCESWAVRAGGSLVAARGYPTAFAVLTGASLLALVLVPFLRRRSAPPVAE